MGIPPSTLPSLGILALSMAAIQAAPVPTPPRFPPQATSCWAPPVPEPGFQGTTTARTDADGRRLTERFGYLIARLGYLGSERAVQVRVGDALICLRSLGAVQFEDSGLRITSMGPEDRVFIASRELATGRTQEMVVSWVGDGLLYEWRVGGILRAPGPEATEWREAMLDVLSTSWEAHQQRKAMRQQAVELLRTAERARGSAIVRLTTGPTRPTTDRFGISELARELLAARRAIDRALQDPPRAELREVLQSQARVRELAVAMDGALIALARSRGNNNAVSTNEVTPRVRTLIAAQRRLAEAGTANPSSARLRLQDLSEAQRQLETVVEGLQRAIAPRAPGVELQRLTEENAARAAVAEEARANLERTDESLRAEHAGVRNPAQFQSQIRRLQEAIRGIP